MRVSALLGRHRVTRTVRPIESAPACLRLDAEAAVAGAHPSQQLGLLDVEVLLDVLGREAAQAEPRPDARGDQRHRQA